MFKTRPKVFEIVPKCLKMSQNIPKCPTQTHRCPNGLVLMAMVGSCLIVYHVRLTIRDHVYLRLDHVYLR